MDAFFPRYVADEESAGGPQLDDYSDFLSQIEQAKGNHSALSFPAFRQQNLTPESSVEEGFERRMDQEIGQDGQPLGMQALQAFQGHPTTRQQWPGEASLQSGMTPDSQHNGSFSPESQASNNIHARSTMAPSQQMAQVPQWSDLDSVFNANLEQAAALQMPQPFVDNMMNGPSSFTRPMQTYENFGFINNSEPRLSVAVGSTGQNAASPDEFDLRQPQQQQQQQLRTHVPTAGQMVGSGSMQFQQTQENVAQHDDDKLIIAQPMAVHSNGGASQPSHITHLSAQAERMGSRVQTMQNSLLGANTGLMGSSDAGISQSSSAIAQSPSASEGSQETLPEMMIPQHHHHHHQQQQQQHHHDGVVPGRRPSMTTDLARGLTHVNLQTESPDIPSSLQPTFKKPSLPQGTTLAERRRQQLPNGLNVQRPKGLNLSRTFSSSAITTAPAGGRFPTSPHATLRRNKSSNVVAAVSGSVLSGRIQKAGQSSARNSPLVASFPEDVVPASNMTQQSHATVGQSRGTPPTPTSTVHAPLAMTSQQAAESHVVDSSIPTSADQSVYTPGLHSSGSMAGSQSWLSTPITTPYEPSMQQVPVKNQWPPASAVPQSAPAHVLGFPRDISSPVMPSMPVTPANMHFPQTHTPTPMHVMQTPMGFQVIPVVPSQSGMSENPSFIPAQQTHFLQMQHATNPWASSAPWMNFGNDPYSEHSVWMMHNSCLPHREIEVKLDAGCQRLKDEVSEGKARLVKLRHQEFSFQNTTTFDMKKQLEEKE